MEVIDPADIKYIPSLPSVSILKRRIKKDYDRLFHMVSQFLNQNNLTPEKEFWKNFTNRLDSEQDKELFKKMLAEYCNYIDIIVDADKQYFPSEPLVIALILSQHKKMINLLMNKVSEHNNDLSNH